MIKAVLFDLDGTLVNSLSDLAASTNYALSHMGFEQHCTDKFNYFVGDGIPKLIERALPQSVQDEDTRKRCLDLFMNHYREHYADTTYVYEGITDLLRALRAEGIKLAVISNKAQEMVEVIASKLFPGMFDIVAGKKQGYPAKPDPKMTLEIISMLGVGKNECILAGDSGMDAAVAVNAGIIPVGVLWGFRERLELIENGADYIVTKPQEILAIVKEINNENSNLKV